MSENDWADDLSDRIHEQCNESNNGDIYCEAAKLIREAFAAHQPAVKGLDEAILAGLQQAILHGSNNPGTVQDILEYILPVIAARVAQSEARILRNCSTSLAQYNKGLIEQWEDDAAEADSRARGGSDGI